MDTKRADIVTSILFIGLGFFVLYRASQLKESPFTTIGSGYFPSLLAVMLIIFSFIILMRAFVKKEKEKIPFPHHLRIWVTVGILVLFFLAWQFIGYFYLVTFLFLLTLFFIYGKKFNTKAACINFGLSLAITVIIYFIFNNLLFIQFS